MNTLDVYFMHAQPFQCPKCGAPTKFEEVGARQHHTCPRCAYQFIAEEDEDRAL